MPGMTWSVRGLTRPVLVKESKQRSFCSLLITDLNNQKAVVTVSKRERGRVREEERKRERERERERENKPVPNNKNKSNNNTKLQTCWTVDMSYAVCKSFPIFDY